MSIDAVSALESSRELFASVLQTPSVGGDLYQRVLGGLQELNSQMLAGEQSVQQLAAGDMDNLHQVLMGMERTRLGFDLLMSVRNRVLEAYQEILRMQV